MDEPASLVLDALNGWVRTLPPESVVVSSTREISDEYGPGTVYRFRPADERACTLDVHVLDDGSCGFFLDSWPRLAGRLGTGYSRLGLGAADLVALYHEPARVPAPVVLGACAAVAAGDVALRVAMAGRKIVATEGSLGATGLPMRGVGGPFWMSRLLQRFGAGTVVTIDYRPWMPEADHRGF